MKKYKITIFNSITFYKREYFYTFIFDAINHAWELLGDGRLYRNDPSEVINRFANNIYLRDGEYVTIKTVGGC